MSSHFHLLLGFYPLISYVIAEGCSGPSIYNLTITKQYLSTPNYGNGTYPPLLDCTFQLKAPDKWHVIIEIERLVMENQVFSECVDYIAFYEGNTTEDSSLIGKFCELGSRRTLISKQSEVLIVFSTDKLFEFDGALFSVRAVSPLDCPPGWGDTEAGSCVKLESHDKENFIGAQARCNEQQSNLLEIRSTPMFNLYQKWYDKINQPIWIGYHDASLEKAVMTLDGEMRQLFPLAENSNLLTGNTDENDCVTAYFHENIPFRAEACYQRYAYACEMSRNWTTPIHKLPLKDIQNGIYTDQNTYNTWLILFIICLLILIFLLVSCCYCMKKRELSRVHAIEAATHNTAATNSREGENFTGTSAHQPTSSVPISPVVKTIQLENNAAPTRVKKNDVRPIESTNQIRQVNSIEVEQALQPIEETSVVQTVVSEEVPALPLRESTFHSLTRDELSLRTRRPHDPFDRPKMHVLDTVSAISLDEFWSNKK